MAIVRTLTNAISRRTRYRRVALRHWSDTNIAAWTVVLALTALMFLAATRVSSPDRGHAFADAIRILVAAFISLVLASLNYAIFAGNSASSYGLNASEEPIIGVGFAVSEALAQIPPKREPVRREEYAQGNECARMPIGRTIPSDRKAR